MKLARGVKGYFQWQRAVMEDETLRDIAADGFFDIRLVALMIAMFGANGEGCFATSETIAALMGCGRKTAERYRADLIRLGWFTEVRRDGGWNKRGLVLSIALPGAGGARYLATLSRPATSRPTISRRWRKNSWRTITSALRSIRGRSRQRRRVMFAGKCLHDHEYGSHRWTILWSA